MLRAILPLLAIAGCDQPSSTIRVALHTQEQSDAILDSKHNDLVRDAAAILGLQVVFTTRRRGAIALELIDLPLDAAADLYFHGRGLDSVGCDRSGWAIPLDPQRVGHELAHMLGLTDHSTLPGNLMRKVADPEATDLEPWQGAVIDTNVSYLRRCW